jgi:peptidoglycan-N-acetylglucosamine deacetylase
MRIRWDRIALLLAIVVLLVVVAVRMASRPDGGAAAATRPRPTASPAAPAPVRCPAGHAGPVLRQAPGQGRTVALTFDDGPSAYTPQVLAVLRRERVHATFFEVGRHVAADPRTVAAVVAAGHLVGNHTWSHPSVRSWQTARLTAELTRTADALSGTPGAGSCWFRPPGGVLTGSAATVRALGLTTVLWSVDSRDWAVQHAGTDDDAAAADRIVARATDPTGGAGEGAAADHPVVLLHDGGGHRGATIAALPRIIAFYRSHGYRFVRIDGTA